MRAEGEGAVFVSMFDDDDICPACRYCGKPVLPSQANAFGDAHKHCRRRESAS